MALSITKTLSSKHEIKSKFVALTIALDYLDPVQYLQENENAVEEMIGYSSETLVIGKYVLVFFEALLRKLWYAAGCKQE